MSSKIKVDTIENVAGSGNVSLGSGHNLVVPGNITGSGNLTIDTNTLVVDATNNKVAVGTNSPNTASSAAALQINKDGEALRIDGTAGTAREIFFRGTSSSNLASVHSDGSLKLRAEDSGTHMEFHTADTLRMNISSEGYVTKPNQPMFGMYSTANSGMAAANSDIILNAGYNGGNHVNTSTGVFTVPVAGRYMFSAYAIKHNQNGVVARLRVVKNGSTVAEARMDESGNYTQACAVVILNLAVNDAIKFTNGDNTQFYMGGTYGRVNGHLIG